MADPRATGTFADSIEQLPDLKPVTPTSDNLAPEPGLVDWLGEGWSMKTMSAARQVQRADRSDFELIMLRDGYAPILEALELDISQNPAAFNDDGAMGPKGEALLMSSELLRRQGKDWLGAMTNRSTQERLIAEEIRNRRAKDPGFLAGVPDTVDGLRAYFLENEKKKRAPAQQTLERSEGLGGILSSLAGSAVESFHDPLNIMTLPIGGGSGTLGKIVGREILINAGLEALQIPLVAGNREILGEELTAGEATANVAIAGVFGGVLEGAAHLGAKGVGAGYDKAIEQVFNAMPASVQRRWADKMTADLSIGEMDLRVPLIELFDDLDNRELAAFTRNLVTPDRMSPDETAAANVLERDQDEGEISPYAPGEAGNARHAEQLGQAINDLLEHRRPQDTPVSQAGADAGNRAPAPERPPATSTAARPRVSGEAAIAGFKAKTRRAESSGNDAADNPNSSADGRYQITDGTFRGYFQRLFGRDPGEKPGKAVKNNPETQERIMDALTRDNASALERAGEAVTEGNLYLYHFLGNGDGRKVLKADPDTPIERLLPAHVIAANKSVLEGKSASQVIQWAHSKMGGSASAVAARGPAGSLAIDGEDPRIAELRAEALALDDQIVGLTKLPDGTAVNMRNRSVPASEIGVDATRFQFKAGGDEFGVTERLKGIKEWDAGLAGRVALWEDEAGKLWIADGHQRHGLARRISQESGVDIPMDAMVLRAADGVSAEEARVWAALKNIAEGTGTLVDAAKVLRDAGAGALDRLPPRSPMVRDGAALSRLSDDAFGAVYNERLPAEHAAVIGHLLPDAPETHIGMVDLLIKTDPANRAQAHSIVRQAIAAGFHEGEQVDLFGDAGIVASLFVEKAKILERGLARLRKMRLVHKTAANEADELEAKGSKIARAQSEKEAQANAEAVAIIDRLAYRAGPVADALTDAARQLAGGGRLADAASQFVERIRELDLRSLDAGNNVDRVDLDGGGREGDAGEADAPLFEEPIDQGQPSLIELEAATARFSDPDGPQAKQQAESLEHDLRASVLHGADREFADLYTARDAKGFVVGSFRTEADAKKAAGKGGAVEHHANAVELVDFDRIIDESEILGTNVSGDTIHFHPERGPFTTRPGDKKPRPNFGGLVDPVDVSPQRRDEILDQIEAFFERGSDADLRADLEQVSAPADLELILAGQRGATLEDLFARAAANQDELAAIGPELAELAGAKFVNPGIKSRDRVLEKSADYSDPGNLKDLARAGFLVTERGQGSAILAALRDRGFQVYDKGWKPLNGYLDRKLVVAFPNGGVAEIQMIPAAIADFKFGAGKKLYERARDPATPPEEFERVVLEMKARYEELLEGTDFAALGKADANSSVDSSVPSSNAERTVDTDASRQDPASNTNPLFGSSTATGLSSSSKSLMGSSSPFVLDMGAKADPGKLARDRQLIELGAEAPLRAAGDVDQRGEIGLELFDAVNQPGFTFRLDDEGAEISGADLLAELEADAKAIETLRSCL